jgi:hypothetical protein
MSWKVRRAAAKCLAAVVAAYPDLLQDIYKQVGLGCCCWWGWCC